MRAWTVGASYGSGLVPVRDGMALEDYLNALAFKAWGVPDPNKWVDDLVAEAAADSHRGLI